MAEFKLERFKYKWRGDWESGIEYDRDDVVRLKGKSYVCIFGHTSSTLFRDDLNAILPESNPPQPQPRWVVMTSGSTFLGDWEPEFVYDLGDIILYDGTIWICNEAHSSSSFAANASKFDVFVKATKFIGNWQAGTDYGHGALAKYNGKIFKCLVAHTAGALLENNINDWEEFFNGVQYRGPWLVNTSYRENDLVKYGGSIFRCVNTHESGSAGLDDINFEIEFPGNQPAGDWDNETYYNEGDIARYGGYLYYAVANNYDFQPTLIPDDSTIRWVLLAKTYNFRGDWSLSEFYKTGDIVQRGGQLLLAKIDINGVNFDGSSTDYLDPDIWQLLVPGKRWSSNWGSGNYYSVGDVIYHLGTAYVCNFEHEADNRNFPGDNGNGFEYWDVLIQSGRPGGLHDKGDLLSYGLTRDLVGDGSSIGDVRVPIGEEGELLSITADLEVFWRNFVHDADVVYVAPFGRDEPSYGAAKNRPFKTIRHASDYVQDNYLPGSPVKIEVATGTYQELVPIQIPEGCVIMGDELRATVIEATPPKQDYIDMYSYAKIGFTYINGILSNLLANVRLDVHPNNEFTQSFNANSTSVQIANLIISKFNAWQTVIDYRQDLVDDDIEVTGTNNLTLDSDYIAGATNLEFNKDFIVSETINFLKDSYPDVSLDEVILKEMLQSAIRAASKDLKYPGTYFTVHSAKQFYSSIGGGQLSDMFYARNITGVRNCTLTGLKGVLRPPGVFELFQRPSGGAFVSLDPGWGPDDERVWIKTRSPYIQGVTTIGTGCIGQKVDGSLHNGGNKSMTSNDFTQVLSDGIGAWISNNARVEMVSVFTYYNQVGYLAELGGVIRATNGNNSYGKWGAIADGNDPTETPDDATVNNRENHAVIEQALAGGLNDHLYVFEYGNCGEHYTSADAEIVGAGQAADVEYTDFRDSALFEARLINTQGSGSEGGSGFLTRQGYAQQTADSTQGLLLSATDITQELAEIDGMRIIIISGDGVGQYGYINSYDFVTKEITVRKESTGELGWDHIVPGTPINTTLNSTCQYRIEPRVTVSSPNYLQNARNLSTIQDYADATFGGTTETYINLNLDGQLGSNQFAEAGQSAAVFRVVRSGSTYSVTMTNAGSGYAKGDVITIDGALLGGNTADNTITINVDEVTEDSTDAILTFTAVGTPRPGRYVAVAQPNVIQFSDNGTSWQSVNTAFDGDFQRVISGNNTFVAIAKNENRLVFSYDARTWTTRSLPATANWIDGTYGNGKFVIVAEGTNQGAYSLDGLTWSSMTLPNADDSTGDQWQSVEYGAGVFIAISGSLNRDIAISTDGINWTKKEDVLPDGIGYDWANLVYGNNRFFALSKNGTGVFSIDNGETWYQSLSIPTTYIDEATDEEVAYPQTDWVDIKFYQGVFVAISQGAGGGTSNRLAITEDAILWTERTLPTSKSWGAIVVNSIEDKPSFIILGNNTLSGGNVLVQAGAQAKVRANVFQGSFESVKIWDPGSGYDDALNMTFSVFDNAFTLEVEIEPRLGNGVLAQPDFINRGAGYRSSSSDITITGDGYADIIPEENFITLSGIDVVPGPGVQIYIDGILNEDTVDPDDLKLFTGIEITDLGDDGTGNDTNTVKFKVSPRLRNEYNISHNTACILRSRYSQCRITGHDFLDIGTGNFEETNYPEIYAGGNFFTAAPENEVYESRGGRVFYTSSDQDGNFRVGELFSVQQATGVVTISAEFFQLDGLSELALGGVRLGGSGTVVREFSTDPTFSEDSNNVVPTQRAIGTFLANRLSVGGENLEVNAIVAGAVYIGSQDDIINSTAEEYVKIDRQVVFDGQDSLTNPTIVSGTIVGQMMFLRPAFNESMQ